jgi:soluble lytic murein transglycosylase-like protein
LPKARTRRSTPRVRRTPPTTDALALLRLSVAVLSLAMLVSTVPPLRGVYRAIRDTMVVAMEVSRATDASRVGTARQALRYDIPFELAVAIDRAARAEGVDPDLAFRLVRVESEFKERAVSSAGALGLTQLMPATAAELQPGITREEMFDRDTNLRLGLRYLRRLLRAYDGQVNEALHAYNRGPGTVNRIRADGGDPANGYAEKVLGSGSPEAYQGNGFLPEEEHFLGL